MRDKYARFVSHIIPMIVWKSEKKFFSGKPNFQSVKSHFNAQNLFLCSPYTVKQHLHAFSPHVLADIHRFRVK